MSNEVAETHDEEKCDLDTVKEKYPDISWKDGGRQILASLVANIIVIQAGINMSFSAILLPQLSESGEIHISKSEGSWIASIVALSTPIGALVIGPIMDKFGRQKMCMAITIPIALSWLLNFYATNIWYIYLARIISGFCSGLTLVTLVYVSEITHPRLRPMLLGLNSVSVTIGILLTCLLALWYNWRTISGIYFFLMLVALPVIWTLPESPHWYWVFKEDSQATARSLSWIYRNQTVYNNEYQRILETSRARSEDEDENETSTLLKIKNSLTVYSDQTVYKPTLVLIILFLFQQLSCAYVIIFYAVDIFKEIGGDLHNSLDAYIALVLLGTIRFVMALVSVLISKRVGRRPTMLISTSGMCITIITAGLLIGRANPTWNSTVSYLILFYICFSSVGYFVVPWALISELLPIKVRGKLGGAMVSIAYIFMFGMLKSFPFILECVRLDHLFYGLFFINMCGLIFMIYMLPETLGKSFNDIEQYFSKK